MLPFKSKYHLCDLFDIPICIDISLIFLLLFFATGGGSLFDGLGCALLLLVSVTAHEFGHALTARSFGYRTRDITLSLLGGCASLIALPKKASQEFLTALAGPAVSFALMGLGVLGVSALGTGGDVVSYFYHDIMGHFPKALPVVDGDVLFYVEGMSERLVYSCSRSYFDTMQMLSYLAEMNLMLGIFNLLPGFPMDGGRIFRSAMRPFLSRVNATYVAMIVGRVVAVFIGLRGFWNVTHGANWGFVTMMIAWMIWREGYREYVMARMESAWDYQDYRAHVSPPPYGGDGDDCDVTRDRN